MSRSSILRSLFAVVGEQLASEAPRCTDWGRRGFLRAGGASLVLAAMPARASFNSAPRVGIVGGGIAGLTAALTLQDAGLACTVYESSSRLGGRVHSERKFWAQGQVSEWGAEYIDTSHVLMQALARRFGLPLDDANAAMPADAVETNHFLGGYYTKAEVAADMKPVSGILADQIAAVNRKYRYDNFNEAAAFFDRMSAYEWIEAYVPGGHQSRLGRYMDLGVVSEFGLDSSELSALNIILPLRSDERFHVRGGNQQIPRAIARQLPAGTIKASWRLKAVEAHPNQTVTLGFDTPSGPSEAEFDHVVLALPFGVLRRLDTRLAGFDERKRAMIEQLAYGTNSKLSLQFDSRYWHGRGAWPRASNGFVSTDLGFQETFESSRAQPGSRGLLTNYTGGSVGLAYRPEGPYTNSLASQRTADYATGFLSQLEQVLPGITPHYTGLATLSYPTGDKNLRASYSGFGLGQFTAFSGYGQLAQGRVHFAGEHTSLAYQGYMEGGAETGQHAALEVLASIRF